MRAWRSPEETGIAALRVVEAEIPEPRANEIVVEVEAAALNFSDLLMIDGMYQIRPERPFTPGQEIAGTVSTTGADTEIAPGTRVAGKVLWGGFADFAVVRADMAIEIPEEIAVADAVALPVVYTTALIALVEDARMGADDTVLIHAAAGGVGLAAVQIAKANGARVIAAATGRAKCDLVRKQGADVVIDYGSQDFVAAVTEATDGRGADIILDSVGGDVTRRSLRCLAWEGQLLIVGFSSGEIPEIPANRLLLRRAVARGIYWDHDRDGEMVARAAQTLVALCLEGRIRPVVDDRYGFDDLPRALDDLKSGRSMGKLVLGIGKGRATA